jgi:RNA polymerase sigma factor (sigma-70 family)
MQVQDIDIAQELVQEAFTRAWASPRTPSVEAEFRRWIYRIIRNLVRDYHRGRSRIPNRLAPEALADPLVAVERRAGDPELLDALRGLGLRERQAIYLRYFEDLSFAETAQILGMPPVTVRVIVHRSLAKLRRRLAARAGTEVAV